MHVFMFLFAVSLIWSVQRNLLYILCCYLCFLDDVGHGRGILITEETHIKWVDTCSQRKGKQFKEIQSLLFNLLPNGL